MSTDGASAPSPRARLGAALLLLAWTAALALGLLGRSSLLNVPAALMGLSAKEVALQTMRLMARGAALELLRLLPLGVLASLALPSQQGWLRRFGLLYLPALVLSFTLALLANSARVAAGQGGSILEDLLALVACSVGAWAGLSARSGVRGALLFVPRLALALVAALTLSGVLAWMATESAPLPIDAPEVTTAEKLRLHQIFSGKNPLKMAEGEVAEVSLTSRDVNLLLNWAASVASTVEHRKAWVRIGGEELEAKASLRVPGLGRYLNVTASGALDVDAGKLFLRASRLRVGRIEVPGPLVRVLAPLAARVVNGDEQLRQLLLPLRRVALGPDRVEVAYGKRRMPKGFLADLFHGEGVGAEEAARVSGYVTFLMEAAPTLAADPEARFGAAVQAAFRHARERTTTAAAPEQAVDENRAALLALGILLGHHRVESFVGRVFDDSTRLRVRSALRGTTMRGREDWPKHFFVSAALTVLALPNVSDAVGLFKEEKDAGGGSGFSFADLLADRCGTTFAEVATRDTASARAVQERLAAGFRLDDIFPSPDGLPEGIQAAELEARYGGTSGAPFRALTDEIERRVAACPGLR